VDQSSERWALVLGIAGIVVLLGGAVVLLDVASYSIAVGAVVALLIVVASMPVLRRLSNIDQDPALFWILLAALVAKLVFSVARYWMVNRLYGGGGDSTRYANQGWLFAQEVRSGTLFPSIESIDGVVAPTRRIIKLTGYLFTATGRSLFAGFFLYSWVAFWGCLLCVRGAQRAFPELDRRRYLYLVMFWPSLLFWPSAIGKDAIVVGFLGLATYGACRLLAPRPALVGAPLFALGVAGMMLIRSHVALMAVLALGVAIAFTLLGGQRTSDARGRGRLVRVGALVVMVLLAIAASSRTTQFFTDKAGEATSSVEALEYTKQQTQQGGSAFEPIIVRTPVQIPAATASVLFRPFPWEANTVGGLISAGEAALVLALFVLSWKRLRRWPGSAWRRPILIYASVYCLMFVVAFSSIGNAGILARQRSQMLPLLFVAFAVPVTRWWSTSGSGPGDVVDRGSDDADPGDPLALRRTASR
jgi:hypothetical protein